MTTSKKPKCKLDDKKFTNHASVRYSKEFPSGMICMDCGTFWSSVELNKKKK